ncbi:geranylgeranyl reductase [Chitinispirillum alkaliphilum]|nr:geranylgeranyl reductase [Chitinispirillum alkaliphilum]
MGSKLAGAGKNVCIVDRRSKIGHPIRCGEATGNRMELSRFLQVDENWIARDITGLTAHINDDYVISREIPDAGVILHRCRLESSLADKAIAAGAELKLNTTITGLIAANGTLCKGVISDSGEHIEGDFIIGADGPESTIGRLAGITRVLGLKDCASTIEYKLESKSYNDGHLHFFAGRDTLHPGYIWVFPKEKDHLLVGGALYNRLPDGTRVSDLVHSFLQKRFPGIRYGDMITGSIPILESPRRLTIGNVLVVGDSARQCNPLTAGGIMNTLEAAEMAIESLLNCSKGETEKLSAYSRSWRKKQRKQQKLFLLLREIIMDSSDTQIIKVLQDSSKIINSAPDRSKPFSIPAIALIAVLVRLMPRFFKHSAILFR